ncbi:MAG: RCC1 domain-containing protein, partial [Limisphaerales bacterium]
GELHGVALREDGTLWSWGNNSVGQLGDGTTLSRVEPDRVNLNDVIAVQSGSKHSVAVKSDGTVWTWGWNSSGQLGDGSTTQRLTPTHIPSATYVQGFPFPSTTTPLNKVKIVDAKDTHTLVLTSDGAVAAWGSNNHGQLGVGQTFNYTSSPRWLGFGNVTGIAVGSRHSAAVRADGSVWVWGDNFYWQIDSVQVLSSNMPNKKPELSGVIAVSAGHHYTAALKADGTIWSWGGNNAGQMGNGSIGARSGIVKANGGSYKAVRSGLYHTLALKQDGTVWAWGANGNGQLGDGSTISKSVPVLVSGLQNIVSIAAHWYTSYAIQSDGTVWVWGENSNGQLGDGTTVSRLTPSRLNNLRVTRIDDRDYDGIPTWQEIESGTQYDNPNSVSSAQLASWSFNNPTFHGDGGQRPIAATAEIVPGWDGTALRVDSPNPAKLSYKETEPNGAANINLRRGSVRFWFKPNWNGGVGTGLKGRLIDSGSSLPNQGCWSLAVDEAASQLTFSSGLNGASVPYVTEDISDWSSSQ